MEYEILSLMGRSRICGKGGGRGLYEDGVQVGGGCWRECALPAKLQLLAIRKSAQKYSYSLCSPMDHGCIQD